jgi:hypothetical protein
MTRPSSERPKVLKNLEDAEGFRCVDIFQRADGTFGFKEFRRDPEDSGRWTLVEDFSHRSYATESAALSAACQSVSWLRSPPQNGS